MEAKCHYVAAAATDGDDGDNGDEEKDSFNFGLILAAEFMAKYELKLTFAFISVYRCD